MLQPCRLARGLIGHFGHLAQHLHAALDGLARAAGLLDRHVAEIAVGPHPRLADQVGHLHHLAAQSHQQDAREIRIARVSRQGAEQRVIALILARHAAAGAMHNRHDPVDIGKVVQPAGLFDPFRDEARDRAGAVHRGQNSNIVARAHPAIGAVVPQECTALCRGGQGAHFGRMGIVLLMRAHAQIVGMDMLARRDGPGRNTDDLAIADDVFALRHCPRRNLVPARHWPGQGCRDIGHNAAGTQIAQRDDDIVSGIQADRIGNGGGHGAPFQTLGTGPKAAHGDAA